MWVIKKSNFCEFQFLEVEILKKINTHTHTHTHTYIYIYIYIRVVQATRRLGQIDLSQPNPTPPAIGDGS